MTRLTTQLTDDTFRQSSYRQLHGGIPAGSGGPLVKINMTSALATGASTIAHGRPRFNVTTRRGVVTQSRAPARFAGFAKRHLKMRSHQPQASSSSSSLNMADASEDVLTTAPHLSGEEQDSQVDWRRAWYVIPPLWRACSAVAIGFLDEDEVVLL